jgi:hypothetical protein
VDIYKWADQQTAPCDYYDHTTGRVYHTQNYIQAKRLGLPEVPILVSEDGIIIGKVLRKIAQND